MTYNGQTSVAETAFQVQGINPPANDGFGNAVIVSGIPFTRTQDTSAATTTPEDPIITCVSGQRHGSVWYRVTPSRAGALEIDTFGSDYDTVLSVWTGTRGNLQSQGCNDDFDSLQSRLEIPVSAGVVYYIEVTGFWIQSRGTLVVNVALNDNPPTPTLLSPNNGTVINRSDDIVLSWNALDEATEYYVEFWGGPNININSGWQTSSSWSIGSQWGGNYQWRVKARNIAGESAWSATRSLSVKYGAPTNLTADGVAWDTTTLFWDASSDAPGNINGYHIYRNGSLVGTVDNEATTFSDGNLTCETVYSYSVKAYKGSLESDASNTATATTAGCLAKPSNLTAHALSWTKIQLSWTDNSSDEASFYVERSRSASSGWNTIDVLPATFTTYEDTTVSCGLIYYYRVRAYRAGDQQLSQPSNVVVIAMPTCSLDNAVPVRNIYTTSHPELTWSSITWATGYEVQVSNTNTFTALSDSRVVPANVLSVVTVTLQDGTYYWRVRAKKPDGTWSAVDSFVVDAP